MKRLLVALICLMACLSVEAQTRPDTAETKHGKRHFGVGFNYTSPAPGLSAKLSLSRRDMFQFSMSQKEYQWNYAGYVGWGYKWNFYSVEYQHRFDPVIWMENVQVYPLIYACGGIGQTRWNANYLWYFGDGWEQYQDWHGYNLGGGVELFPTFFKGNMGFTMKLGFGSYATANSFGYSVNGGHLLFGGSVHYYIL